MIDLRKHAIALHFVKSGDVVIDAGAFIGSYSFLYRRIVGSKGLVFAYEAQPKAASTLKAKVEKQRAYNILVRQKAVSSTNGTTIRMKVYLDEPAQSCTVEPLLMNEERMPGKTDTVEVQTEQLDALQGQFQGKKLSLIKIDTEGHESQVIQGATQVLAEHQPFVVMEYGFIPGKFEPTSIAQLQKLGYTCFDLKTMQEVKPQYISYLPTDLVGVPKQHLLAFWNWVSSLPQNAFILKAQIYCQFLKATLRGLK